MSIASNLTSTDGCNAAQKAWFGARKDRLWELVQETGIQAASPNSESEAQRSLARTSSRPGGQPGQLKVLAAWHASGMQVTCNHALGLKLMMCPSRYDYIYELEVRLLAEVMLLYGHSPACAGRARGPVDAVAHFCRSLRRQLSFPRWWQRDAKSLGSGLSGAEVLGATSLQPWSRNRPHALGTDAKPRLGVPEHRRVFSSVYRNNMAQPPARTCTAGTLRSVLRCPVLKGELVKSPEGQPSTPSDSLTRSRH